MLLRCHFLKQIRKMIINSATKPYRAKISIYLLKCICFCINLLHLIQNFIPYQKVFNKEDSSWTSGTHFPK